MIDLLGTIVSIIFILVILFFLTTFNIYLLLTPIFGYITGMENIKHDSDDTEQFWFFFIMGILGFIFGFLILLYITSPGWACFLTTYNIFDLSEYVLETNMPCEVTKNTKAISET